MQEPQQGIKKLDDEYSLYKNDALGEGSFRTVYKGKRNKDATPVAISIVHILHLKDNEKLLRNLEFEAKMNINHPFIMSPEKVIKSTNKWYFVYEYYESDLSKLIKEKHNDGLPLDLLEKYACQILIAVQKLHNVGICHRDLKPSNFILSQQNQVKLADFSVSGECAQGDFMETVTGTPLYMAPEILDGEIYDHKVDVWSLGCALFEMATGSVLFKSKSLSELPKLQKKEVDYSPLEKRSPEFAALTKKMLCLESKERASISELLADPYIRTLLKKHDLEQFLEDKSPVT